VLKNAIMITVLSKTSAQHSHYQCWEKP
jgi:hypothetical protein